mmetsp:Transcript_20827/g.60640  ORF Transcript_20827/g.60640 Transcript_20827/m.60640 type:complete len:129 (-) Transcript_20827:1937-2323(-)
MILAAPISIEVIAKRVPYQEVQLLYYARTVIHTGTTSKSLMNTTDSAELIFVFSSSPLLASEKGCSDDTILSLLLSLVYSDFLNNPAVWGSEGSSSIASSSSPISVSNNCKHVDANTLPLTMLECSLS